MRLALPRSASVLPRSLPVQLDNALAAIRLQVADAGRAWAADYRRFLDTELAGVPVSQSELPVERARWVLHVMDTLAHDLEQLLRAAQYAGAGPVEINDLLGVDEDGSAGGAPDTKRR